LSLFACVNAIVAFLWLVVGLDGVTGRTGLSALRVLILRGRTCLGGLETLMYPDGIEDRGSVRMSGVGLDLRWGVFRLFRFLGTCFVSSPPVNLFNASKD
jgi:hypothetical protein